jgi:hypothetical protein
MTRLPTEVELIQGSRSLLDLFSCAGSLREQNEAEATTTIFSVRVETMECNFNGSPNNAAHVSGSREEDGVIMESSAVSLVGTVFSYSRHFRMFQSNLLFSNCFIVLHFGLL